MYDSRYLWKDSKKMGATMADERPEIKNAESGMADMPPMQNMQNDMGAMIPDAMPNAMMPMEPPVMSLQFATEKPQPPAISTPICASGYLSTQTGKTLQVMVTIIDADMMSY